MGAGIICDTRQQRGKHGHVDDWFTAHGVPFTYHKLDFGDYSRDDGFSNIVIDTKKDMDEVAQNIGRDHARFVRECDRARDAGHRLIILVEQHAAYNDRNRIASWIPGACRRCVYYRHKECRPQEVAGRMCKGGKKPLQGSTALKIITALESRHGVRFAFCTKRDTAKIICDTLGIEYE